MIIDDIVIGDNGITYVEYQRLKNCSLQTAIKCLNAYVCKDLLMPHATISGRFVPTGLDVDKAKSKPVVAKPPTAPDKMPIKSMNQAKRIAKNLVESYNKKDDTAASCPRCEIEINPKRALGKGPKVWCSDRCRNVGGALIRLAASFGYEWALGARKIMEERLNKKSK